VKDTNYIIHVASPLPFETDDYERDVVAPAVKGTIGILKSALKAPTVQRIVITSSIVAVIPWKYSLMGEVDITFTADDRIPDSELDGPFGHSFQAYSASKAKALNATDAFVKTQRPHFDVINVMPSFFIGQSELVTTTKEIINSTSGIALSSVLGNNSDAPTPGVQIHVDDVAKLHVLSLDPKVKGRQNFGMTSGALGDNRWEDARDIVKKQFPEAVKDGRLPANGLQPTKKVLYDTSKTEEILGIKFRSFEDQIVEATKQYLELLGKEKEKVNVQA